MLFDGDRVWALHLEASAKGIMFVDTRDLSEEIFFPQRIHLIIVDWEHDIILLPDDRHDGLTNENLSGVMVAKTGSIEREIALHSRALVRIRDELPRAQAEHILGDLLTDFSERNRAHEVGRDSLHLIWLNDIL